MASRNNHLNPSIDQKQSDEKKSFMSAEEASLREFWQTDLTRLFNLFAGEQRCYGDNRTFNGSEDTLVTDLNVLKIRVLMDPVGACSIINQRLAEIAIDLPKHYYARIKPTINLLDYHFIFWVFALKSIFGSNGYTTVNEKIRINKDILAIIHYEDLLKLRDYKFDNGGTKSASFLIDLLNAKDLMAQEDRDKKDRLNQLTEILSAAIASNYNPALTAIGKFCVTRFRAGSQEHTQGIAYLRQAAAQNNPKALYYLGTALAAEQRESEHLSEEAIQSMIKAAKRNYPRAVDILRHWQGIFHIDLKPQLEDIRKTLTQIARTSMVNSLLLIDIASHVRKKHFLPELNDAERFHTIVNLLDELIQNYPQVNSDIILKLLFGFFPRQAFPGAKTSRENYIEKSEYQHILLCLMPPPPTPLQKQIQALNKKCAADIANHISNFVETTPRPLISINDITPENLLTAIKNYAKKFPELKKPLAMETREQNEAQAQQKAASTISDLKSGIIATLQQPERAVSDQKWHPSLVQKFMSLFVSSPPPQDVITDKKQKGPN